MWITFFLFIAASLFALYQSKQTMSHQNVFNVLSKKYVSMIPGLISKYGEFPRPFKWIYSENDFSRIDESDDFEFYANERLVYHIDENARTSLTMFYAETMNAELMRLAAPSINVLDICSSWISHFPKSLLNENKINAKGIGMNGMELSKNEAFKSDKDWLVQDLNENAMINADFAPNDYFDIVTIAVSIDYLINPKNVIYEILRTLKPNGLLILSWSNRMFWTKAIKKWTESNENERVYVAASFLYYYYVGDEAVDKSMDLRFDQIDAFRIDDETKDSDPMYTAIARKKAYLCDV